MVLYCPNGVDNMDRVVTIDLSIGSLAVLISGLYVSISGVSIEAIPSSLYIEIAEKLIEYLPINIDEFVNGLIIAPRELFTKQELIEIKDNPLYIERRLGNVTLIATARWNDG